MKSHQITVKSSRNSQFHCNEVILSSADQQGKSFRSVLRRPGQRRLGIGSSTSVVKKILGHQLSQKSGCELMNLTIKQCAEFWIDVSDDFNQAAVIEQWIFAI